MELIVIIALLLIASSVFLVSYVSISNRNAVKKLNQHQ